MSFETACHPEDALAVTIMYTGLSVVNTLTCVSQHPITNQLFPGSAVDCTDRPMLLNITCDCSGCLSVYSTTCSASCFMWLMRTEDTLDLFSSETLLLILVDIYYYLTSPNRPVMGTIVLHKMSSCAVKTQQVSAIICQLNSCPLLIA